MEQDTVENFRKWMLSSGYTLSSLAKKMNYSYDGVYQALNVRSCLSTHFKWRFAQVFGWETARELFEQSAEPDRETVEV